VLQALAPALAWLYLGRVISGVCGASWIIANAYIADIVLPETLDAAQRRVFEWARANPFSAFKAFQSCHGVVPICVVLYCLFVIASDHQAIWAYLGIAKFG